MSLTIVQVLLILELLNQIISLFIVKETTNVLRSYLATSTFLDFTSMST